MATLAIVEDLVFRSKLEEAAAAVHAPLEIVNDIGAALRQLAEKPKTRVLVDLNWSAGDAVVLITTLRQAAPSAMIIGYCSHIHAELRARAIAAGCSVVLPRSVFVQRLPELLQNDIAPNTSAE